MECRAASSAASIARCWRVFSNPTTPVNSPAMKMGTIALVWAPTPPMTGQPRPAELSPLLKHTLRPARSSAHTGMQLRSSQVHGVISVSDALTPGAVHSLISTSNGSPSGPVRVCMRLTRSTRAASPISPNTPGIAARTSGASSSRRLARAEAVSSRSRACNDSLMRASSSAHGPVTFPRSNRARLAFIAAEALPNWRRPGSLPRRSPARPAFGVGSILRGSAEAAALAAAERSVPGFLFGPERTRGP